MSKPKFIVNKKHLLVKYPGKGGWVYTTIESIPLEKREKFGWVQVSGNIDGYELKQYKLMPVKDGRLFLPIKAEIRKKINKKEGDLVLIQLYIDNTPIEVPEEFLLCLHDDKEATTFFNKLTESEKKHYTDWIYSAKKEETKIERMAETINRLKKKLKRYDVSK